jgi:hypothetical protein
LLPPGYVFSADCSVHVRLGLEGTELGILLPQPPPNARAVLQPSAMAVRESIAAALVRIARICPGDLVVDPMVVRNAFPIRLSLARSIRLEVYLCRSSSCQETEKRDATV